VEKFPLKLLFNNEIMYKRDSWIENNNLSKGSTRWDKNNDVCNFF